MEWGKTLSHDVDMMALSSKKQPLSKHLIFSLEVERPFFTTLSNHELRRLQALIKDAQSVLWITYGSLMEGTRPECNMINGIVNALRVEMPFTIFSTLDLDEQPYAGSKVCLDIAWTIATRNRDAGRGNHDTEFRLSEGVLYCSRIIPDKSFNTRQIDESERSEPTNVPRYNSELQVCY